MITIKQVVILKDKGKTANENTAPKQVRISAHSKTGTKEKCLQNEIT